MLSEQIGTNIRRLRQENAMTQSRLAELLCVSHQMISRYETGGSRNKRNHTTNSRLQSLCCIHLSRMIEQIVTPSFHIIKEPYSMKKRLLSCEFNIDTACVELKYSDGTMIAIDTIAVESEIVDNMYQHSEFDYLIYNVPLEYADLILNGDPVKYLKEVTQYKSFEH